MDNFEYGTEDHSQIVDTVEAFALIMFFAILFKRMRHHVTSGVIFVVSSISAFVVMMTLNMSSDWAYLFFGLVAVAIISCGSILRYGRF